MSKSEKKDEGAAAKPELTPEEEAAKSKKKKLLIIIIGGVLGLFGIGGGLGYFLASGSSAKAKAEKGDEQGEEGQEKSAEGHGEKKEEHGGGHGEKKEEHGGGHGEKKEEHGGGHGEKKEEHGEKKEEHGGGHGEKKEEHGGGHGEKKEEHGGGHGEKKEEHGGGHGEAPKTEEKKDPKTSKIEGVDFGCTVPIPPFHLNLGNPLENHYIRLEIAVEYDCEPITRAEFDKRLPQLRDAAIAVTSRKSREFLLGPDGKTQLRKEIFNRLNQYMNHKVDDIYITDILIE
jgi:flagellar basal body-associated protein FliL